MGSLSLLQRIFPTQGLNPGLPHYKQTLYQLSHQGSWRILEWVAYPFTSLSPVDLPDPGIEPGSPALQANCLPTEPWGKPCGRNCKLRWVKQTLVTMNYTPSSGCHSCSIHVSIEHLLWSRHSREKWKSRHSPGPEWTHYLANKLDLSMRKYLKNE